MEIRVLLLLTVKERLLLQIWYRQILFLHASLTQLGVTDQLPMAAVKTPLPLMTGVPHNILKGLLSQPATPTQSMVLKRPTVETAKLAPLLPLCDDYRIAAIIFKFSIIF
jgi:hypothetical protein